MSSFRNITISTLIGLSLYALGCAHQELDREPASMTTNRVRPNTPEQQDSLGVQCTTDLEKAPKEIFLKYNAYWVSYNPRHRLPNWVMHELYKDALERSCARRNDNFHPDDQLKMEFNLTPVDKSDYKNSGYDRGHMAPSADFQWSQDVNNDSFAMTNMSPQTPNLNQKAWNSLEGRIRRWACGNGHLKIYTGPVIKPGLRRLGSCVAVPEEFFKVVLSDVEGQYKAIGFIYKQEDGADPVKTDVWQERAITVAEVENRTGLKFYTEFPKDIADNFKNNLDIEAWEKSEVNCRACDGHIKLLEK
jgi:endonuclease G